MGSSVYDRGADLENKKAWGEWLSKFNWQWFVTMTLRNPVEFVANWTKPGFATAKRAWREFEACARPALDNMYWVRFFEMQRWRGVPHIHALVGNVDESVRRMDLVDWAYGKWGIARVEVYNSSLGAAFYVCKYVSKQLADIDFSGGFRQCAVSSSVSS